MRRTLFWGIGGMSIFAFVFAVACSDEVSSVPPLELDASDDSSTPSPESGPNAVTDAGAVDAKPSPEDADTDASFPECSEQGFCKTDVPSDEVLSAVWGDGVGTVWAVTESGKILRWDGTAWTNHASVVGALYALWGSSPTDIWIGGAGGLFHSEGSSSATLTWRLVPTPGDQGAPIRSIWGTGPGDVWAAGALENIYDIIRKGRVVHFGGELDAGMPVWSSDPIGDNGLAYWAVWGSGESDLWLSGSTGWGSLANQHAELFRRGTSDAGTAAWLQVNRPALAFGTYDGRIPSGISFGTSWWTVERTTEGSNVFWRAPATNDIGAIQWTVTSNPIPFPKLLSIWGNSDSDLWMAGEQGFLRHWDGERLQQASVSTNGLPNMRTFRGLWGTKEGELWAVGEGMAVHRAAGGRP